MFAQPTIWLHDKERMKPVSYEGKVVDNNDPLKLGRLKVRVIEYYGDLSGEHIPDELLPWINQFTSSFLGNSADTCMWAIPVINTYVMVEYPTSDPYFGYYKSSIINENNRCDFFDEDYPHTYGFKDSQNNYVRINKLKNDMEIGHNSGTTFKIKGDSEVTLNHSSGTTATIKPDGNVEISATNTSIVSNVSIQGNLTVSGQTIIGGDASISGKSFLGHTHNTNDEGGMSQPPA